ncbi:MAG: hypothetical protein ACX939_03315 [Hyphococcus sp.]
MLILSAAMAAAGACASAPPRATAGDALSWGEVLNADITAEWSAPENRAFDFWIGEWAANWRPREGLDHQAEGARMRHRVFPILGGKALVELAWPLENTSQPGQRGFSIRYYDPARARWVMAQNWPNGNNTGAAFLDQLIGDEHLGRLSVYSYTERPNADGEMTPQHRRYNFTDIRPGVSFRWDGSNTADEGATWFTWYVVDFLREGDLTPFRPAGAPLPGVHAKALCTEDPHGAMNTLAGNWRGERMDAGGGLAPAHASAGLVLDGCGVVMALEADGEQVFMALGYHERSGRWVIFRLDDRPGAPHAYFVSDAAGAGAVFAEAPGLAIKDELTPYLHTEHFSTDSAKRRLTWETISETELVLREDAKAAFGDGWSSLRVYRFSR